MMLKNTSVRYGSVAIIFHWLMAVLIIMMLCVGFYMTGLVASPQKMVIYGWHKSFGLCVLMLALIRIIWRWYNNTPRMDIPLWEKYTARIVHFLLYILMLVMPLSGWMMSSAAGHPPSFFGFYTMPGLIAVNPYWRDIFSAIHEGSAFGLAGCIGLHIVATIKHHFWDKDNILRRIV